MLIGELMHICRYNIKSDYTILLHLSRCFVEHFDWILFKFIHTSYFHDLKAKSSAQHDLECGTHYLDEDLFKGVIFLSNE